MVNSNSISVFQGDPEELKQSILDGVRQQIEELKKEFQPKQAAEFLTRNEVRDLLKVDLSTVHNYTKRKILKAYSVGNRVYYKRSEVEEALIRINE